MKKTLSNKERHIMGFIARNPDRTFTHSQLMKELNLPSKTHLSNILSVLQKREYIQPIGKRKSKGTQWQWRPVKTRKHQYQIEDILEKEMDQAALESYQEGDCYGDEEIHIYGLTNEIKKSLKKIHTKVKFHSKMSSIQYHLSEIQKIINEVSDDIQARDILFIGRPIYTNKPHVEKFDSKQFIEWKKLQKK